MRRNSTMALFADDSKFYNVMRNSTDSGKLQNALSELNCWCNDSHMAFDTSKCKVLNISKKVVKVERSYPINTFILETVPKTSDLGLTVTDSLSCNKHIEGIAIKVNRKLGLNRRLSKGNFDLHTRKHLYFSLVRPQLVYASEVWSQHTTKYKLQI